MISPLRRQWLAIPTAILATTTKFTEQCSSNIAGSRRWQHQYHSFVSGSTADTSTAVPSSIPILDPTQIPVPVDVHESSPPNRELETQFKHHFHPHVHHLPSSDSSPLTSSVSPASTAADEWNTAEIHIRSLHQQTNSLFHQGEYGAALIISTKATELAKQHYGDQHPAFAAASNNTALLYKYLSQHDKATEYYQAALKCYFDSVGDQHPSYLITANNLALLYRDMGQFDSAIDLFTKTLQTRKQLLGEKDASVATTMHNLASIYRDQGNHSLAIEYQKASLTILRQRYGSEDLATATAMNNLAYTYKISGDYTSALSLYHSALGIRGRNLPNGHPDLIISLNNLAECLAAQGEEQQALEITEKIIQMMEAVKQEQEQTEKQDERNADNAKQNEK